MIPAKIVMASPETIWLTRIVIVKKAWMSAIAPPATMEASDGQQAAPAASTSATSAKRRKRTPHP